MYRILLFQIIFFISIYAKDSNIMLLKNFDYKFVNDNNIKEFLVSEKLDGVRAIWNGKELKTRNGNIINAPKCFTNNFPNFSLDGELWSKRNDFSNISSIVKKLDSACESWKEIKYYVFDVPPKDNQNCNNLENKLCFLEHRLQILQDYLKNKNTTIRIIKQEKLDSIKSLESKLQQITRQNGEGLVIRKNFAPYESGRSNNAFKLKMTQDSECKVKGYTKGKGKFEGKMGAIICTQSLESFNPIIHPLMTKDNKKEMIEFKIGSGFNDKMRENPPKIDSIITYKFQGFSKNGLPKFPVFLRIYEKY